MAIRLIETVVSGTSIRMRFADQTNPADAKEWIEFQVPLSPLKLLNQNTEEIPLGPVEKRSLELVREAALRYVQNVISEEMRRA